MEHHIRRMHQLMSRQGSHEDLQVRLRSNRNL
jgi:hypothetical protein